MSEFSMLILLIVAKASLILGIVLGLNAIVGLRWPMGCTAWQRAGILSLIAMPICLFGGMVIELPILAPGPKPIPTLTVHASPSQAAEARPLHEQYDNTVESEWLISAEEINAWRETNVVDENAKRSKLSFVSKDVPPIAKTNRGMGYFGWLLTFYIIGISLGFIRLLSAYRGLTRLRKSANAVQDALWQASLDAWRQRLKIRQRVSLLESNQVSIPMTFGWVRPVILVSVRSVLSCTEKQRDAILVHELTHVARKDFLWQLLTQLMVGLYWVHPLAWLVRRQSEALRERLCDYLCSQQLGREDYARSLIEIASGTLTRHRMSLGMAMAQQNSLRQRIDDLHSPNAKLSNRPNRLRTIVGGTVAFMILGLIALGFITTMKVQEQPEDNTAAVAAISVEPEPTADLVATGDLALFNTAYDAGSLAQVPSNVVIQVEGSRQITLIAPDQQQPNIESSTVQFILSDGRVAHAVVNAMPASPPHTAWFGLPIDTSEAPLPFGTDINEEEIKIVPAHGRTIEAGRLILIDELESEAKKFNQQVAAVVNGEKLLNGEVLLPFSKVLKGMQKEIGQQARDALLDSNVTSNVLQFHVTLKKQTNLLNRYYATRQDCLTKNIASHVRKMVLTQRAMSDLSPQKREELTSQLDEQFTKRLSQIKHELQVETNEQLDKALDNLGLKVADLRSDFFRDRLSVEYLVLQQSQPKLLAASEIADYYNSNPHEFSLADAAEWQEICFEYSNPGDRSKVRHQLQQALRKLHNGVQFNVENMRPESSNPSSSWTATGASVPLDVVASTMKRNVIRTTPLNEWSSIQDDGACLFVVRVMNRNDSVRRPLAEVEESIREKLIQKGMEAADREVVGRALAEAKIESPYIQLLKSDMPAESSQ